MTELPSRAEQAKAYQKKRHALQLTNLFLTPAILFLTVWLPISFWIQSAALKVTAHPYGTLVVYFALYSLYMILVDFPLTVYSGYSLEKEYRLTNLTFYGWLKDFSKKALLSFLFSTLLILALYFLIWKFPGEWWIFAWAGFAAVSYGVGKVFPVLIVPLFYKYGKVEDEALKGRILELSKRYGLPVENVYSINLSRTTKKANAAFMGMGKTKRVVLSDTLLEKFSGDEIIAVVAHELGHYKHKDIWKQLTLGMISSFAGFWVVSKTLAPAAEGFGFQGIGDIAALPVLFLIFYLFYLALTPLQNGFSRLIERAADRFALKAFPKTEAFISCMQKLGDVNLADSDPHPVYEWFFYDHPALSKRIKMAREWRDPR